MTLRAASVAGMAAVLGGCAATAPLPAPGAIAVEAARYSCTDGLAFTAVFDPFGEAATLTFARIDRDDPGATAQDRRFRIALDARPVASGFWYAGSGWSLRGKGSDATVTRPDGRASACRAGDRRATTTTADT